jgi:hypothetical protein
VRYDEWVRLVAICALAGCGRVAFDPIADASAADDGDAAPCTEPFGSLQPLPTGGLTLYSPSISHDELELYTTASVGGQLYELHVSTRATRTDLWSDPVRLADPPNSPLYDDQGPSVSSDGLLLSYTTLRSGNAFIFQTQRASRLSPWGPAAHSGAYGAGDLSRDNLTLAVQDFMSPIHFWRRASTAEPFVRGEDASSNVNDGSTNLSPSLSADGRELYFMSNRDGTMGIWVAGRESDSGPFITVAKVPLGVEATQPEICADGNHLYVIVRTMTGDVPHVASRCD